MSIAATDLPRGWSAFNSFNAGQTPALSIPSPVFTSPAIAHVLTQVNTQLSSSAAAAVGTLGTLYAVIGALQIPLTHVGAPGGAIGVQDFSWTGQLEIQAGQGLTVEWNFPVPTNYFATLSIQGYDI